MGTRHQYFNVSEFVPIAALAMFVAALFLMGLIRQLDNEISDSSKFISRVTVVR